MKKMGDIIEDNISRKINDMKNHFSMEDKKTPYGKVVVIQNLLFSKITDIVLSLPIMIQLSLICK